MNTFDDLMKWVRDITYPGLKIIVKNVRPGVPVYYIQVQGDGKCSVSGMDMRMNGRKWLISEYMTKSEVVQTALKAVITYMEHEVREHFRYRGEAVFGPHLNIDALHEISQDLDVREAA